MSNTLHVHIKHEIEYGTDGLNWQINGTEALLKEAGCHIGGDLNDDAIGDWEIDENEFQDAVKKIKQMPAEDIEKHFDDDYVGNDKEKFKKCLVDLLQEFADTGDHRNGYYHFSWF